MKHGKNAGLLVGSVNATPFTNKASMPVERDMADVTCFKGAAGAHPRSFLPGTLTAKCEYGGFIDGTADPLMVAALTVETAKPVTLAPEGLIVGAPAKSIRGLQASYVGDAAFDGAVAFSGGVQATSSVWLSGLMGSAYSGLTTVGTTFPAAGFDSSASSANGMIVAVHVTGLSGTGGPTVKATVQDASVSNFADLASIGLSAVYSAPGSEVITIAGTIRRYVWVAITITGTLPSADIYVALHRL